jgi:OOP family OmpA-OmpF porin
VRKLIFILLILGTRLAAQVNLVPNSSFEDTIYCPDFTGQINRLQYWSSPTNATPDIITSNFCDVYLNSNMIDSPLNLWGFQYPRTGNNYAGLGFYSNNPGGVDREYIQVQLNSSLISGKRYCVKYYVSLADELDYYAIKNIDAYFSTDSIYEESSLPNLPILNFDPQITGTTFIADTISWKEVSGYFTATGGEKYMIIGNFKPQDQVDAIIFDNSTNNKMAYYYVDDVSVIECDSLIGIEETIFTNKFNFYPNPAKEMAYLSYTIKSNSILTIYNTLGQILEQKPLLKENSKIELPLDNYNNGLYLYNVFADGKPLYNGRFIVAKD